MKLITYFICNVFIFTTLTTDCHRREANIATSIEASASVDDDIYPIVIDIREAMRNKTDYKLSDIVDSITYISIESSDEFIASVNTNMIRFSRNYIVAEHFYGSGTLMCFDRSGKFIGQIAKKGRGPGEYNWISDVAIDDQNDIVYVLSYGTMKIFKYSLQGAFLGEINTLPLNADKIIVDPTGLLLVHFPNWRGNLEYSCLLLDSKGDTLDMLKNNIFYSHGDTRKAYQTEGIRYIYNDLMHIKSKGDTLLVVKNNRFIPKYVFDTGVKRSNMTISEYDEMISFRTINETDDNVFFQFQLDKRWYSAYYDKKSGKAFSVPSGDFSTQNRITQLPSPKRRRVGNRLKPTEDYDMLKSSSVSLSF